MSHEHADRHHAAQDEAEMCWLDFWAPLVAPDGVVDVEAVKAELHDYHALLRSVPEVYDHVTNGRVSKPNTMGFEVIAIFEENRNEEHLDTLQEAVGEHCERLWPDESIITEGLALAEEAGEVCRAILKRHHGIRGSRDEWTKAIELEVSQVANCLLNIAHLEGFSLIDAMRAEWERFKKHDLNHDPIGSVAS